VRVFSRRTLKDFAKSLKGCKDYKPVKAALDSWFHEVVRAKWKSPADLHASYRNASIVGPERAVFNIKGNSYRLVVAVDDPRQAVFIKWIGTHADYDDIDVRTIQYGN